MIYLPIILGLFLAGTLATVWALCSTAAHANTAQDAALRHMHAVATGYATGGTIPAQRDRRSDLPGWLFEDDPCAERWPDGGAVVEVGDMAPEDFA